ncbi:methionyl-tRNA formyltransferase [soil metagenome]
MSDPNAPGAPGPLPLPPAHPRRLVYLGTPEMAVPPLRALHEAGFEVALVVTGQDKRRGRRAEPTPTPVKGAAIELGLPVSHDLADVPGVGADLGVVVAYGRILRRPLLEVLPMVNLHFSLLPRWRGAAPVERAILAGDARTGVCVMALEEGLDTGGVYASAELAIRRTSTAAELAVQLTTVGSRLLVDSLQAGLGVPVPQTGEVTYAAKFGNEDLRLDWVRPAAELDRIVRVGGAWTQFRGRRLKVLRAKPWPTEAGAGDPGELHGDRVTCGAGSMQLLDVQPEGKGAVPFADWANGARPLDGEPLGLGAGS